jgi:very-short-patch-repair endonuclease
MSPRDLERLLAARPHLRVAASTPLRATGLPIAGKTPNKAHRRSRVMRKGPTPHDLLWGAVIAAYPQAEREFKNAIPGRRFRLDIALPAERLAIEVDGWEWHGKHKGDFQKDRSRQNLLTTHHWRILRFTAGEIRQDLSAVMATLAAAIDGDSQ